MSGELGLAAHGLGLAPLLGQVLPDAQPEVPVSRLVAHHGVIRYRHSGHLDDAALNGVDEGEIGDYPGKEGAFGIAGAPQKRRGWRKDHKSL